MQHFQLKLLLLVAMILLNLSNCLAGHTNILAELGSHMDVSCSDQRCDRNVNERLVGIIESSMNMDADPCENFYKYACGNWTKSSEYSSSLEDIEESFTKIYVNIFEKWHEQVEKGEELKLNAAYEKALKYYSSCTKLEVFNLRGVVMNIDPAPQQKWPIFENRSSLPWNFENFVWWKVLAKLQSYDMENVLLSVAVDSDIKNRLKYAVVIRTPSLVEGINGISATAARVVGNFNSLQIKLLRWKLLSFEKQLNKVIDGGQDEEESKQSHTEDIESVDKNESFSDGSQENKKKENTDETKTDSTDGSSSKYNINSSEENEPTTYLTLSELQSELPGIDWQEYFNILLQGETIALPNDCIFTISNDEKTSVERIIKFLNESSKETVALYLLAYFIDHVVQSWPYYSEKKHCANFLRGLMPLVANHIYEDNYYGAIREESDAVIRSVFDRLRSKLNNLIDENNIDLTEVEIEYLQRKSNKMSLVIGNLPDNKTKDFLVEYYATVNITNATNFYHNHLELLHHKQMLQYRILNAYHKNTNNVYETFVPVTGVDASASPYHLRTRNLIAFPFAYLQMPLYHHKLHDVFQYAELGFTTGHEIMHGFDANGVLFDADGNLSKIGEGISKKRGFQKKLDCLTKKLTASVDERIADVAGIRLVMEAFFNDRTSKARKFHTDSTSLTNRQLFFVKLSQYFCEVVDEDYAEVDLTGLSHDLSNVRVVYTMSNTREFAHEFKCDVNKALKLDEVCQLW